MSTLIESERFQPSLENLSDFAWRTIDRVFRFGTEQQKSECVRSFYQRVDWEDEITLIEMFGGPLETGFVLLKDGQRFAVQCNGWKFKLNGMPIRDANLADALGVPVAFLDGLSIASQFFAHKLGTRFQQGLTTKAYEDERKKLEAARRALIRTRNEGREAVVKSLRRMAEKQLSAKQKNAMLTAVKHQLMAELTKRCKEHDMPAVPVPTIRRTELMKQPAFSGLYFEWDGLLCTYVGKSVNVPSRVGNGHHKLEGDPLMSFMEMHPSCISRNEHFYIWLLNPAKNGGLD